MLNGETIQGLGMHFREIGRIGCLLFSSSSGRASLRAIRSVYDKLRHVNLPLNLPRRRDCKKKVFHWVRVLGTPLSYWRAD
jgi:hypothetical protein